MITIEDIIEGIRSIMRETITSTDKVEKIINFINSVEEGLYATKKEKERLEGDQQVELDI